MTQLGPRPNQPSRPSFRPPRRGPSFVVVLAVALAAVVLPAAAMAAFAALGRVAQSPTTIIFATPESANVAQVTPWQGAERVNILLLGIDQRPAEDPKTARTDTMILFTLDPATKSAGMMSIPRDLYVPIPNRGTDRINTAHAIGGAKLAMETVQYNFGVPINHTVRVNFDGFVKLVDLLGGIDVFVEQDIADAQFPSANFGYEPFNLKSGWQHLDGSTALKYARTRHGNSDFARMKRQQQVIMAVRDKALKGDVLARLLPQAPQIFATLQQAVQTDLSVSQLVQLALLAKDVPPERIARVTLDESAAHGWTTPQGGSVLVPDRDRVRELRNQFYSGLAAAAPIVGTPEVGRIGVQNGTQTNGLAANTKALLEAKGFTVAQVGDAPQPAAKTFILAYRPREDFLRQLAETLGIPTSAITSTADPNNGLDAVVVLGDDFKLPAK